MDKFLSAFGREKNEKRVTEVFVSQGVRLIRVLLYYQLISEITRVNY